MPKYLEESQVINQLNVHRPIEQWLGSYKLDDKFMIKFVTLYNDKQEGYYCCYGDYEDIGNENYCDIYSFYTLEEEPYDLGYEKKFSSQEEMLKFCYDELNASSDKFVAKGILQDIYLEYVKTRGN